MMSNDAIGRFIGGLIARIPVLACVRDDHVRALGEVFPHMLMADLRRFVSEDVQDRDVVNAVLGYLEEGMSSQDESVIELIAVSFLENMDPAEPAYEALSSRMGPLLRAELARLRVLWK